MGESHCQEAAADKLPPPGMALFFCLQSRRVPAAAEIQAHEALLIMVQLLMFIRISSLSYRQSQSGTRAESATGLRYIHHASRGSRVLLFMREHRREAGRAGAITKPFRCLGFAAYESHEGERPMAIRWRL
jgi:hypothetical protein